MELNSRHLTSSPSRSIIFDLDGTLIDSQESILTAINMAMHELRLVPKVQITKSLVGPPLMETLAIITGLNDPSVLNQIAQKFKIYYDNIGYRQSIVFPGIHTLLELLKSQGYDLYIATNKRLIPTRKIINHFQWKDIFLEIYSIDLYNEIPFRSKADMLSALLNNKSISNSSALYVGDRLEDYEAAEQNNLRCILVDWGYGVTSSSKDIKKNIVNNTCQLLDKIKALL